jgi:hypothetical protein
MTAIIQTLDKADYVVISSNRLQNSIPRNVLSYPVSRHYYEMLDDWTPRLQEAARVHVLPVAARHLVPGRRRAGVVVVIRPPARAGLPEDAGLHAPARRATAADGPAGVPALPKDAGKHGLLMSESMRHTQVANGTWTSVFSSSGLRNRSRRCSGYWCWRWRRWP